VRQVDCGLNTPRTAVLHKPVYKRTPVFNNLSVEPDLGVLKPGRERPSRRWVDDDLLQCHRHYVTGDLGDRREESFGVCSIAAKSAVDEAGSQPLSDGAQVTSPNRGGELSCRFRDFVMRAHRSGL